MTMINILLLLLAVSSSDFSLPPMAVLKEEMVANNQFSFVPPVNTQLDQIQNMLQTQASTLSPAVINKVITALKCATEHNVDRNNILTVIDYSLPSNQKRLWVFDLQDKKLLFHTYVSHGIRSGTLFTEYFSNINDSKASSIGVYRTDKSYYGREGLSLKLTGLDKSFNDNAANRYIVMHGGWYMDENFIKRYGRAGRSWGCPAVPLTMYQPIINTIKDNSLLVVYYPSDEWFVKSKFLTCGKMDAAVNTASSTTVPQQPPRDVDLREAIMFVDVNQNNQREEDDPIVVMSADSYERVFHAQAPLGRMLRRQINNAEYIALSKAEFNRLVMQNNKEGLDAINFVIPVIVMSHGYYETQMKIVPMGKIKDIRLNQDALAAGSMDNYSVNFEAKPPVHLKATSRFIRWLGL
jgi:hypothetical protein